MNVKIWNEEVDANRRYVFIRVDKNDIITNVKIITGDQLAALDNTGTLTTKNQATMHQFPKSRLYIEVDTTSMQE